MFRCWMFFLALWFTPLAWAGSVDLNKATLADLDALPGIGPAKAQAILDYRTQNGPFTSIQQIEAVPGIGPATFAQIQGLIAVGGGTAAPATTAAPAPAPAAAPAPAPAAAPAPTPAAVSSGRININTAGAAELENLPGIGPSKAAAIVDERTANGPFASCNDLDRVAGIGPATIANLGGACATQ
jgi:competence protein ComEA